MPKEMPIPSNWFEEDENIDTYIAYLLEHYKEFKLTCTTYDEEKHSGLDVTMSRGRTKIKICKAYSPRFDSNRGGQQSRLENVPDAFGSGDYGYAYDAYIINGKFVSIVGDTEQEYNLAKQVNQLYLKIRSKTIPTKEQLYQRQAAEKAAAEKQALETAAQQTLLDNMKRNGDITGETYKKYAGAREQIPETMGPRVYVACWVFNQDTLVLMGKRQTEPGNGTYAVPGGYLNLGESPEHAAMRILFEETGIEISETEFSPWAYTNDMFYDKHHILTQHYLTFHCVATYRINQTPKAMKPDTCKRWAWGDMDKQTQRLFLPTKNGWDRIQISR